MHKNDLKQIDHYLKATSDNHLIMKPYEKLLNIERFPYADFAGMYRNEAIYEPVCV